MQNENLRALLGQKEEQLWLTTVEAEHALDPQKEQFRSVAQNYETHARDITSVEVAQSEVKVHRRMQGAMHQQSQELKTEQNRLRATRTEAQTALIFKDEIVDHAENVLQMPTDAVAYEARQALHAKRSQIDSIEEHALQYIHTTEVRAQGEVMGKDIDLQRQTQDIMILQKSISRLADQVSDSSMNIQDPMISEQQLQNMMMNEAESFSYIRHEMTQEMNHWKREALISQQLQRKNLAKS